ncbi:MAG: DUF1175 family protein [Elusimicrobiota bacterium]
MAGDRFTLAGLGLACALLTGALPAGGRLTGGQSAAFRGWFIRIVQEQFRQGPSPRWTQRDCAGLVRFAAAEALKDHDERWLKANGVSNRYLPPEVGVGGARKEAVAGWKQVGSRERGAYASAIAIVQENSAFVSKDVNQARPGDLLFFDQGEDQHLMIWMGHYIAYHTGRESEKETGLRSVRVSEMMKWKDTRWRPVIDNPNFVGVYRFSFLSR